MSLKLNQLLLKDRLSKDDPHLSVLIDILMCLQNIEKKIDDVSTTEDIQDLKTHISNIRPVVQQGQNLEQINSNELPDYKSTHFIPSIDVSDVKSKGTATKTKKKVKDLNKSIKGLKDLKSNTGDDNASQKN